MENQSKEHEDLAKEILKIMRERSGENVVDDVDEMVPKSKSYSLLPDYPYVVDKVISEERLASFEKMYLERAKSSSEEELLSRDKDEYDSLAEKFNEMARGFGDENEYDALFCHRNLLRNWSNYLEVVSRLTNGKVPEKDIWMMAIFVEDWIGRLPLSRSYSFAHDHLMQGRIVLASVLIAIPSLLNDLSVGELRRFVFCMLLRDYIEVDTPKVRGVSGKFAFSSVEVVEALYDEYAKDFLGEEGTLPLYDDNKPFGYSKENPILAVDIPSSYSYMRRLRVNGRMVFYVRRGSLKGVFGEILDVYRVFVNGKGFSFTKDKEVEIYVNPYWIGNSVNAPKGFTLE